MFFHLFDNYTKELHEILGLAFVFVSLLHVFVNWKSMKSYFKKSSFLILGITFLAISALFILNAENEGVNPKRVIIGSVLSAKLDKSLDILNINMISARVKLENHGFKFDESKSIKEIAFMNKISPFEVLDIIIN